MKKKIYLSKEQYELSHKYVIVEFNIIGGETISTIYKYFCTKKEADKYFKNNLFGSINYEVMTLNNFYKDALMCL